MPLVQHASSAFQFTSGTAGTGTVSFKNNIGTGHCLVACVTALGAEAFSPSITVTTNGAPENWAQSVVDADLQSYIFVNWNCGGGQPSITVTFTFGSTATTSNSNCMLVDIYELSGMVETSAVVDESSSNDEVGIFWSSGGTGVTSFANEIWIGVTGCAPGAANSAVTITGPSSPWTNQPQTNTSYQSGGTGTADQFDVGQLSGYQVVSGVSSATYSGSLSPTGGSYSCIITLVEGVGNGAAFYPVTQAARAKLPHPPAGPGVVKGQVYSRYVAPVVHAAPTSGPVVKPLPAPVRAPVHTWQPRAGRVGSSFGAPVQNPIHGPPVYALQGPIQASAALQPVLRGRVYSNPGSLVPLLFTNSFEGGTNSTTITVPNSGGASGTPFSNVVIGSGATAIFSTTEYAHGSLSSEFATGGTAAQVYALWGSFGTGSSVTHPVPQNQVWFRFYAYLTANPASAFFILQAVGYSSTVVRIQVNTNGTLSGLNASGSTIFTTTTAIPLNQWFRVEGYIFGSSSNGQFSLNLFYPDDSQTPVESHIVSGTNTLGPIGSIRYGITGSNVANIGPFWLDDIGLSNTGPLGPSSLTAPPSQGFPARARIPQTAPRGRIASSPGAPVQNPPPPVSGPPVYPLLSPVQAQFPPATIKGRVYSNPGAATLLFTNNFDGGTNGVTITTGNSGGVSGTPFSATSLAGGGTLAFSNAEYAHGSLSGEFATSSGGGTNYVNWSFNQYQIWFRFYLYMTSNPGTAFRVAQFNSAAGIFAGAVQINTTGTLEFIDSASNNIFTTATPIPLNSWCRVEGFIIGSVNIGQVALQLFYGDSQTPAESHISAANRSLRGTLSAVRFGINPSTASIGPFWLDSIGISNSGYLGPASFTGQASSGFPGTTTRARIPQTSPRGRISSNPGGPVQNPAPPVTGPPVYPLTGPVRARVPLPVRGRVGSSAGSLPSLLLVNNFNGGTNGVAVSTGNSGGASGNAFQLVNIGSGAVLQFDNTTYVTGSLSAKVSTGGSAAVDYVQWYQSGSNAIGVQPNLWYRLYIYFTANPVSTSVKLWESVATGTGSTQCGAIQFNNAGKLQFLNTASSVVFTTTNTVPLNQWIRIEGYILGSSTNAAVSLSLFTGNSQVPFEVDTATGVNTLGPITQVRFACVNSAANIGPFWLDSIGISNTGYLGPASYNGEASSGFPGTTVQPRIPQNTRGRVIQGQILTSSFTPPPVGPPFAPATSAVRAKITRPISGSVSDGFTGAALPGPINGAGFGNGAGSGGGPVRNPSRGPVFTAANQAIRAKVPHYPISGSVSDGFTGASVPGPLNGAGFGNGIGSNGGPVQNPPTHGPVFRQATSPARVHATLPTRGRIGSNKGGPVSNPVPPITGPVFFPARQPARIRPSFPVRGRIGFNAGALVRNPVSGPVFRPATEPARARVPQVFSKGRVGSAQGIPAPFVGPVFRQADEPARVHASLPVRGRISSNAGGPVRNVNAGPVFRQGTQAIRIRATVPVRGRVSSNAGTIVAAAAPAPVRQLGQPVRARSQQPARGRVSVSRIVTAAPLPVVTARQNQPVRTHAISPVRGRVSSSATLPTFSHGPVFKQVTRPVRIHPVLPPRGVISSHPGAPVHNPTAGPVFRQATQPARIRPSLPPRGVTSSNGGAPVNNPPHAIEPAFTIGAPQLRWSVSPPIVQWQS